MTNNLQYLVCNIHNITHEMNINTVEPTNNGHTMDWSKWPLYTGDSYTQVDYNKGSHLGL